VKSVMRILTTGGLLLARGAAVLAEQPAQDGFVPVGQLPAVEQLPAAPLVIAAYAFIWVALLVYVGLLWRRVAGVDRELASLRRAIEERR
jgi:CcmD family protein